MPLRLPPTLAKLGYWRHPPRPCNSSPWRSAVWPSPSLVGCGLEMVAIDANASINDRRVAKINVLSVQPRAQVLCRLRRSRRIQPAIHREGCRFLSIRLAVLVRASAGRFSCVAFS